MIFADHEMHDYLVTLFVISHLSRKGHFLLYPNPNRHRDTACDIQFSDRSHFPTRDTI